MDQEKRRAPSFVRKQRPAGGGSKPNSADEPVTASPPRQTPPSDATPPTHRGERARIVVPRQERGIAPTNPLNVELREVRYGAASKGAYLRYTPGQSQFKRGPSGDLEATALASRPRGAIARVEAAVKRVLLGNRFATSQLIHERLSKIKALSILGSDPLSSSAYATEEMLLVLVLAGTGALVYGVPIALVIAALLVIVAVSYRQTIRAYPGGGGAYLVAHANLGVLPGVGAAASLMVDYVVLVSVSVAAGVAAITSALPELSDYSVPIGVATIALMTLGNLRGIREAGTVFAAPTYFFIVTVGLMIVVGMVKVIIGDAPGSLLDSARPETPMVATQGLTLFLILRAFASGSAALTGVEAISNGVPNFKTPESLNARNTLTVMAGIAIFLFLGITYLASRFGLVPTEDETLVSLLGRSVFGENVLYYGYQATTALVLFLAANTSFNAFPLLSAILARDRFMPRQFTFRGDRLAFSNGIMLLAGAATILLIVFDSEVTRLIPLYAVGVFVSFTLSQSGMVRHWLRLKEQGWRASLLMNGTGAVATGIVAVIITGTKFTHGAWISVLMMLTLASIFLLIRRHYDWFERKTHVDETEVSGVPMAVSAEAPREHVIVPVDGVNKITLGAIGMAREISNMVTAVHLTDDPESADAFRDRWHAAVPDVPLLLIESPYRAFVAPMMAYLERLDEQEEQRITVILPTFIPHHWWERFLHNRDVLRLRRFLKQREGVRVVDFPYRLYEEVSSDDPASV